MKETETEGIDASITVSEGDNASVEILLIIELEGLSGWDVEGFDGSRESGFGERIIAVAKNGGLSLVVTFGEDFGTLGIPDNIVRVRLVNGGSPPSTVNS